MSEITEPGAYDIDEAQYHADPCPRPSLSATLAARHLSKSPAHAWIHHPRLNPDCEKRAPSAQMQLGAAVHALTLQGVDPVYIDADNFRGEPARNARIGALSEGKTPLLEKQRHQVEAMRDALQDHLPAQFEAEKTLIWRDNGAWYRARPDMIAYAGNRIVDIKTTALPATRDGWGRRQIFDYAVQSGFYRRGYRAIFGHKPDWEFLVVEVDPPYGVGRFRFSEEMQEWADKTAGDLCRLWRGCIVENHWPCYSVELETVEIPGWLKTGEFDDGLITGEEL